MVDLHDLLADVGLQSLRNGNAQPRVSKRIKEAGDANDQSSSEKCARGKDERDREREGRVAMVAAVLGSHTL